MPEVFLEFIGDASPWLFLLLIPLYFWGKLNHDALHKRATHPESFERTIGWLQENNLGLLYLKTLGWLIDKLGNIIGDRQKINLSYFLYTNSLYKNYIFNAFTTESYEKCLYLAFLYPILSFFLLGAAIGWWTFDKVFPENIVLNEWERIIVPSISVLINLFLFKIVRITPPYMLWMISSSFLIFISFVSFVFYNDFRFGFLLAMILIMMTFIFLTMYMGGRIAGLIFLKDLSLVKNIIMDFANKNVFNMIILIGFVTYADILKNDDDFSYLFNEAGFSSTFNMISIFSIILSFVGLVAFLGENFVIFILFYILIMKNTFFSGVFSGFVFMSFYVLGKDGKNLIYWLIYNSSILFLSYLTLMVIGNEIHMMILLFFVLLPLANALLDWVSLGVTRGLLQAIRTGQHSGSVTIIFALVDLVLALVFLFLITAVLVGVTALGNGVSGKTLVNIGGILQDVRCEPSKVDHWWIYFMLLSTLVPTLIHFALAGGAATLWIPRPVRLWLADGLERDQHKTFLAWLYLTFTPVMGFIVVPGALLYFLWWLVTTHDAWLGTHLLDWADMLAGREAGICEATLK